MNQGLWIGGLVLMAAAAGIVPMSGRAGAGEVAVSVDNGRPHQTMEGFGATHTALAIDQPGYPKGDSLAPELRRKALEAVYSQVRLTMGNIDVHCSETAPGRDGAGNDNDDPRSIDWQRFRMANLDLAKTKLVDPAQPLGFDNHFLGRIPVRWNSPWLGALRKTDHRKFVEEYVEQIVATSLYWRDTCKAESRYNVMFLNEPTSGNRELDGGSAKEMAAIIKLAGQRLKESGFKDVRFVVPNEETVRRSREVAEVILADEEARQYVAAVGYHCYPYGSPYASAARILKETAVGHPNQAEVEERHKLRDLAAKYKLPLWMTEVSHPGVPAYSMELLRGRAVHIHDELVHADAAAFFAMMSMWDTNTHNEHYKGRRGPALEEEGDNPVLVYNDHSEARITGTGYAIGHYARWVRRGAVRIEAASSDPLVKATAFRDDGQKRFVLVVINNSKEAQQLTVTLKGLGLAGKVTGEQSADKARWQALDAIQPDGPAAFKLVLPALSVTSLGAELRGN